MRTIVIVSAAALLLGSFPSAPALGQDDAGLGVDAPDDAGGTLPDLALGEFRGVVDAEVGDLADWYALCGQVEGLLEVILEGLGLRVKLGSYLFNVTGKVRLELHPCADVGLLLQEGVAAAGYRITVARAPTSDVSVGALEAVAPPLLFSAVPARDPFTRQVRVEIENLGARGDWAWLTLDAAKLDAGGGVERLVDEAVWLEPGGSFEKVVTWRAGYYAGDVEFRAQTSSFFDAVPGNDAAVLRGVILTSV